jgi:hypothetical protein
MTGTLYKASWLLQTTKLLWNVDKRFFRDEAHLNCCENTKIFKIHSNLRCVNDHSGSSRNASQLHSGTARYDNQQENGPSSILSSVRPLRTILWYCFLLGHYNHYISPFHSPLINQPFDITQSELLADSLYKTHVSKFIFKLTIAKSSYIILAMCSSWCLEPNIAQNSMHLIESISL